MATTGVVTTNDTTTPPGFTKQPDGTLTPTASYTLLARRVHEHQPLMRDARHATVSLLNRLVAEFTSLGIKAAFDDKEGTLDVTFPPRWITSPLQAGVDVNVSKRDVWTVRWSQVDTYDRSVTDEPTKSLVVRYEPERKAFAYQNSEGRWHPDAGEGLMALILQRVPYPAVPNGSNV